MYFFLEVLNISRTKATGLELGLRFEVVNNKPNKHSRKLPIKIFIFMFRTPTERNVAQLAKNFRNWITKQTFHNPAYNWLRPVLIVLKIAPLTPGKKWRQQNDLQKFKISANFLDTHPPLRERWESPRNTQVPEGEICLPITPAPCAFSINHLNLKQFKWYTAGYRSWPIQQVHSGT